MRQVAHSSNRSPIKIPANTGKNSHGCKPTTVSSARQASQHAPEVSETARYVPGRLGTQLNAVQPLAIGGRKVGHVPVAEEDVFELT